MNWLWLIPLIWLAGRYPRWMPVKQGEHMRSLMYHRIDTPKRGQKFRGLRVSAKAFEAQLRWLKENGWQFLSAEEAIESAFKPRPKTVWITFDDGYEDNYTDALPLLKKYGAKATLFLVPQRHDNDWSVKRKAHHDSGELAAAARLSDEQVIEMLDSGVFDLGAHTLTHANLPTLSDEELHFEIAEGKKALEERFNTPVNTFAYPFGLYDARCRQAVADAGFKLAVTTNEGMGAIDDDPLQLNRVKISGKDKIIDFPNRIRLGRRSLWR